MAKMIQMPEGIQNPTKQQRWIYANFTDSFVFSYIIRKHKDITKEILERIMPELKGEDIRIISHEIRLGNSKAEKEIICDILIKTKSGKIIGIEMQNKPLPHLMMRARGYTAVLDSVFLKKGDIKYDLPEITLIIICAFDPAERERYFNDQASYFRTDPDVETNDGRRVIWLNPEETRGPVSEELKAFLNYVIGIEVNDALCDNIDRAVMEMKRNYFTRRKFMFFTDYVDNERRLARNEGIDIGLKDGISKGESNKERSLVIQNFRKGTPVEMIAEYLFMKPEEVLKILKEEKLLN